MYSTLNAKLQVQASTLWNDLKWKNPAKGNTLIPSAWIDLLGPCHWPESIQQASAVNMRKEIHAAIQIMDEDPNRQSRSLNTAKNRLNDQEKVDFDHIANSWGWWRKKHVFLNH